jgi:transposase
VAAKAAACLRRGCLLYKQRNVVERAFCRLRQYRAVATRYDKRDFIWRGTIDRIWLRHPVS